MLGLLYMGVCILNLLKGGRGAWQLMNMHLHWVEYQRIADNLTVHCSCQSVGTDAGRIFEAKVIYICITSYSKK
jgi:hypothetical protein